MIPPVPLLELLAKLHPHEVAYGYGGLKLFEADELEEAQVGYSVGADGRSLCSAERGLWQPDWLVIGCDTGLGDPIFVDIGAPNLPVFTAMTGQGLWEPKPVAISLDAFAQCWREFEQVAQGRDWPENEGANPLSKAGRDSYLGRIKETNDWRIEADLWEALLAYGEDADL